MLKINRKGWENMTGFQVFSIAVDVVTIVVDIAVILYIARGWKK